MGDAGFIKILLKHWCSIPFSYFYKVFGLVLILVITVKYQRQNCCIFSKLLKHFHQLGPLGRFGLVVAKSVCVLFVCVLFVCLSPSHAIFLCGRTSAERASFVDWCGLILISISIFSRALKTWMCSSGVNRVSIFDLDLNFDLDLE